MPNRVIVSIDDQHLPQIHEIAEQLKSSGFVVDQVMDVAGIITGEVDDHGRHQATRIPGVLSVENEGQIDIGPPGSPVS